MHKESQREKQNAREMLLQDEVSMATVLAIRLRKGGSDEGEITQKQSSVLLSMEGWIFLLKPVTRGCGDGVIPRETTIWRES